MHILRHALRQDCLRAAALGALALAAWCDAAAALTCAAPEDQARYDAARATLVLLGRAEYLPGEAEKEAAPPPPPPPPAAAEGAPVAIPLPFAGVPPIVERRARVTPLRVLSGTAPAGASFEAVVIDGPCSDWAPDGREAVLMLTPGRDGDWILLGEKTKP